MPISRSGVSEATVIELDGFNTLSIEAVDGEIVFTVAGEGEENTLFLTPEKAQAIIKALTNELIVIQLLKGAPQ
jgi:hypothetical protein